MSDSSSAGSSPEHADHLALDAETELGREGEQEATLAGSVAAGVDAARVDESTSTALDVGTSLQDPAVRRDPQELTRKRNRVGDLILREPRKKGSMVVSVPEHAATLAKGFQRLRESGQLCDVTVRVDGKDFKAHRAVLAASSDMLNVMLLGQWADSNDEVIELYGVDRNSFEHLLNFMYKGSVAVDKLDDVLNLLLSSEHLGMATVRDSCITQLKRYLDLPNALQIRAFAQEICCVELVSAASEVVMNQFAQVAATSSDYLDLDATRLGEIIASDALAVDTEQEVLDAVLKWARHDWDERKAKLPALMAKVRLPLLPPDALKDLEEDQLVAPILHAAPDGVFAAHLAEAHQWHAARAAEQPAAGRPQHLQLAPASALTPQTRPRRRRQGSMLLALGGRPAWTRVEKFEPVTRVWSEVQPMSQMRMRHGSATVNGQVYVVGGKNEQGQALTSVERYDPHLDVWYRVTPMKSPRTGLGVASLGGKLYAIGGRSETGYRLNSTECYHVQTDAWVECATMKSARGAVRCGALNKCIYAVGGRSDNNQALNSVEAYDTSTNEWREVAPMQTARVGAGVEVMDGKLYAIGGKDENGNKLRSVECYDPAKNQWEQLPTMGTKRWGAGVAVMDHRLYVIGGANGAERGQLPTVEVYDPQKRQWSEVPTPLPRILSSLYATILDPVRPRGLRNRA